MKFSVIDNFIKSEIWDGQFIEIYLETDRSVTNKIIIGNFYRPPRQTIENVTMFISDLEKIFNNFKNKRDAILTGDFNLDLLKFKEVNYINKFLESVISNGYIPKITLPTHVTQKHGSLIDNMYVKICNRFENIDAGIIINQISDHLPYFMSFNHANVIPHNNTKYIKMTTYNEEAFINFKSDLHNPLIIDQLNNILGENPDISYDKFHNILHNLTEKHFPSKYVRFNKYIHKKDKWITSGILRSIKFKDKLYALLKSTSVNDSKYENLKFNFKTYSKILKSSIRMAKINYYNHQFDMFKNDMRKTWMKINEIINKDKKKKNFPEQFLIDDKLISDKSMITNKFNQYFVEIGPKLAEKISLPKNKSFEEYLRNPVTQHFSFSLIDKDNVIRVIESLKSKFSYGHDKISNRLLKYVKHELAHPLKLIINQSFEHAIFPELLKIAKVTPLHKKNNDQIFDNYRPISVLPSVSKVFERIMYNQIYDFFSANKIFFTSQYGFRKSHSTELAALELVNRILIEMDKNRLPINIYLDLSKAFDTLDHDILMHKLSYYGFKNKSYDLLNCYLTNRKQYVEINGTTSKLLNLKCGVPQGSILGPLLFIIYINDITNATTKFHPIIYADDTTLSATLNSFGNENEIAMNINNELKAISDWLKINKLSLNINKTKAMIFHSEQRNVPLPDLFIEETVIEFVNEFNFLGLTIDKHLKWKKHTDQVSKKLSKTLGVMTKLKNFLPTNVLRTIYNSLIHSYINYGIVIWGWQANNIFKLQKRAIRTVSKTNYTAHTSPLFRYLKILKLPDICALHDLKFCYKLTNNLLPPYFVSELFLIDTYAHNYNTRQSNDLRVPAVRHVFATNGMSYRYPVTFNNMNTNFKDKISTHSLTGFILYVKHKFIESYEVDCSIPNCHICKCN